MTQTPSDERRFWRQPLVHFLLAGAVIFALDALRGPSEPADRHQIIVTVAQVERIASLWQKTWGRPPSEKELQALVRDHIKEEVYYREALKLGLDVNDTVIRRRLRQKMEFLTADDAALAAPTEDELHAYYQQNAERYRRSPVFDFEQVYLSLENRDRAPQVLDALRKGEDPEAVGDTISLPRTMRRADEADIARAFGSAFYEAFTTLEPGEWVGPVVSGFGQHLVRITRKEPSYIPALDDVRATVENDWRSERSGAAREEAYSRLLLNYDVAIEVPRE